jgi:hypothetical protein
MKMFKVDPRKYKILFHTVVNFVFFSMVTAMFQWYFKM